MSPPIPVNRLTGFLGSGKTTLLRHILACSDYADCAVLINEFGEIGIDHHLIERVDGEVMLMRSGCVCCTIRDDLAGTVRSLYDRREAGTAPPFRRLIIESTGLADPTPILATIMNDIIIRHHFRLGNVIATVDAVNGQRHLDCQPESIKQVAVADRLLITKVDLAPTEEVDRLEQRLAGINAAAPCFRSANTAPPLDLFLDEDAFDATSRLAEIRRWLAADMRANHHDHDEHDLSQGPLQHRNETRHGSHIHAFAMTFAGPLDWSVFGVWLTLLLQAHGKDVLRVKGILNVTGLPTPVAIHGVQHLIHPPVHLESWPDDDRRSRIVFIVRDIAREDIERSFAAFQKALGAEEIAA
jgi:G3E family GTPase